MDDIKSKDSPRNNPMDSLDVQMTKSINGWRLAFFVTLVFLLLQNLFYSLKEQRIVGVENGKVVGEVLFDESRYRSSDIIIADIKNVVSRCSSVNKNTITEDLSVCLNHMSGSLAESRLEDYANTNYVNSVATTGCEKTSVIFDSEFTGLTQIDRNSYMAMAELKGDVMCNDYKEPIAQGFYVRTEFKILRRSETQPFAVEIQTMEDL